MRTNGVIQWAYKSDTQFDVNGDPIKAEPEWSEPIKCLIQYVTNNKGVHTDGQFTHISLKIHVEAIPPCVELLKVWREGLYLGEFEVLGAPVETTMSRTIIYV